MIKLDSAMSLTLKPLMNVEMKLLINLENEAVNEAYQRLTNLPKRSLRCELIPYRALFARDTCLPETVYQKPFT